MRIHWYPRVATLALVLVAGSASAAEAEAESKGTPKAEATQTAPPAPLDAIVRGVYVQTSIGGGYAVVGQKADVTVNFPTEDNPGATRTQKVSEKLGAGSYIAFALGYDLTDSLAFQLLGGAAMISGGTTTVAGQPSSTYARDLGLLYGGAGLRLALDMSDRLDVVIAAGGGLARADNAVDAVKTGPMFLGSVGLEYYVHVRHFSVGLDLTGFVPLSPMRAFVGLGPQIKYSF